MKKLYSLTTELRVIRTLTVEPDSRAAQAVLAKVDESYFASETARAAFRVCRKGLRKKSEIPDWEDLITDPSLDEDIRETLENCDYEPLDTKKRVMKAIDRLNDYRKYRLISKLGREAERILTSEEAVNIDEEFTKLNGILSSQTSGKNFKVLRIGKNSNSQKHVKKLLAGTSITYLPTGFKGFDDINRGIPAGSSVLVGSPTGGGKSTLLRQLSTNFAEAGAKVGVVPLEMANEEMLQRNVASVANIEMTKLLDPVNRLKSGEAEKIEAEWLKYDKRIEKVGGAIEFYEFDEDITIETLTATVKPFGLDVLIIDYLGLLDGTTGEQQWQLLGNAARYCHVWGKANNCIVVAAAQLSDEGLLRYAKAMQEHAKYFWYWTVSETAKATGVYEIIQRKARQASDHPFYLHFDLPRMTVTDADKDAIEELAKARKDTKTGRKDEKVSKSWENGSSVGWDEGEDDDLPEPVPGKRAQKDVRRAGKRKATSREVEL